MHALENLAIDLVVTNRIRVEPSTFEDLAAAEDDLMDAVRKMLGRAW